MSDHLYRSILPVTLASGHVALTPELARPRYWLEKSDAKLPEIPGMEWWKIPAGQPVEVPGGVVFGYDAAIKAEYGVEEEPMPKPPHKERKSHSGEHSASKRHKQTPKKPAG